MNIAITGSEGFLGKNLVAELENQGFTQINKITRSTSNEDRKMILESCDILYHLAGVNRPENETEFRVGNVNLLEGILEDLKSNPKKPKIVFTSSIQAELKNTYGQSKLQAEKVLDFFSNNYGNETFIYRLPNLFGKWSKQNYNSVVSTFCYNISRNIEININNPDIELTLNYVDDVVIEFINILKGNPNLIEGNYLVSNQYKVKLGKIVELLKEFKSSRETLSLPNFEDRFEKTLYSTYLSFLPKDSFSYDLKMNIDERGSFTEFLKTKDRGQVSINVIKPGITKGNHWHHTKNEKFLVVSGEGIVRFRKYNEKEVIEYQVSSDKMKVIDIPVGYTHSILNKGRRDLVTVMWVNEIFDPKNPDTFYSEV